ncbi:hypothetical protein PRABACTJOHN_02071 [Parabacteroides johnsonii DSM 18315]|uniref:Uncharacterized protein n=1 Tax=Parabacteroides johnsonii DSM 18315 TaxID=537006 RepID=B7BAL4_9BACT|nr:hypothetical protein PRABACTJOHN_02071 [Parabacteroides johnsonii DSM 18315]
MFFLAYADILLFINMICIYKNIWFHKNRLIKNVVGTSANLLTEVI